MKKYNGFLMMCFLFSISTANGFEWNKCKGIAYAGLGGGWFTSSTQWTSSFGKCSMMGLSPFERPKVFVAMNIDKLSVDSSKGNGEYLASFSKLASCDTHTSQKLPDRLQNNLKQIYGVDLQSSAEEVYNRISELVRTDKELSCKYLGS